MNPASSSRRAVLCLIGFAPLLLAGCGRKAEPKPPLDADPLSPRTYPVDRTPRDSSDPLPPDLVPPPLPPAPVIR